MKIDVVNLEAKNVGSIELADEVFGVEVRRDILARMVNYQLAKRRSGNHKSKQIWEVSGTTKKPYNQKGTGRARQGSLRSAQFRGGGVIFGPVVRSHAHELTKKVRLLALRVALSAKAADGKLVVLDKASAETPKTKALVQVLTNLKLSNALFIDGAEVNVNFALASRNIPFIDVLPSQGANVYDILRRDTLVLTTDAVQALEARLK
ncbi:50S ribosomal protein L4 [Telmatospirillum sp.]|uniref:50S ribosomal protein L4 n=1 Tax=Telmatospirillum sp. TaxID=2079197 RepID=UPI00283F1627|nr:50S ribosomal protein L4 [Telmatospirillum sp.]MDR3439275.1 50S ribosomal protein L4 [Telmatospirillum sp.]